MLRETRAKISRSKGEPNCFFFVCEYSHNEPVLCIKSAAQTTFFSLQPFLGQAGTPGSRQKYPQFHFLRLTCADSKGHKSQPELLNIRLQSSYEIPLLLHSLFLFKGVAFNHILHNPLSISHPRFASNRKPH